ncbi:MAG: hypothetical protein CSA74_03130 [Rhodobacterales bacterium]|nr:MAG: hypothetical protein CSA74_03130 [Rhodobacterales bacterium]
MTTPHPDLAAILAEGERILWQGQPKPGRPISPRATLTSVLLYLAAFVLFAFAWWLELFKGHLPGVRLAIYGIIGSAAFCTYMGLRLTLLDRRRARARDAATRYAITDRRVLVLAGPYRAEVPLTDDVQTEQDGDTVTVSAPGTRIRLERLDDAKAAHGILLSRIGEKP